MAGASQQQIQKQNEELARQQQRRQDVRRAQGVQRKATKNEHQHKVVEHERAVRKEAQKQNWLAGIARTAQQAIQNRISSVRRPATPQENFEHELDAQQQLRQQQAAKDPLKAGGVDALTSVEGITKSAEEQKLTPEQKREMRAQFLREQKQQLRGSELKEHVQMHQFLNQFRVVHGSGRPNPRILLDQGLSLEEIKRIFEAYVISFFHELALATSYLVRAYTQWVKGGHREERRAPIGLFGEIVRQMQFSRGPAAFDDSDDAKKKKKLALVATATGGVPQSGKAAYGA